MTALTDRTDPRWTPAQLAHLAAFEAAPTPPEIVEARVVEEVARAIAESGYGAPGWTAARGMAAAAVTAYRAAQDGGAEEAVRRVEALVEADHPRMIPAREVRTALRGSRQGHGASEGDPSL